MPNVFTVIMMMLLLRRVRLPVKVQAGKNIHYFFKNSR